MRRVFNFILCGFFLPAVGDSTMKLTSDAFNYNTTIPIEHTKEGANMSPLLSWSDAPAGTKSFALIVDDPDAPGKIWVHWVLFNIPAATVQLKKGVTRALLPGVKEGINDFGTTQYDGPMPPKGHGQHRYFFKLYALDTTLDLPEGATKDAVVKAMQGHVLATAELIGLYERK